MDAGPAEGRAAVQETRQLTPRKSLPARRVERISIITEPDGEERHPGDGVLEADYLVVGGEHGHRLSGRPGLFCHTGAGGAPGFT